MNEDTIINVAIKVMVNLTKRVEAMGVLASRPYLREQCMKQAPDTICYWEQAFKKAIQDEHLFAVNGLYSTKRPTKFRTLDDNWDC